MTPEGGAPPDGPAPDEIETTAPPAEAAPATEALAEVAGPPADATTAEEASAAEEPPTDEPPATTEEPSAEEGSAAEEPAAITDEPPAEEPATQDPSAGDDGFGTLGLRDELLAELRSLGYEEATPIQREAIPPLLQGRDLLGQAATGTGKTAAFALPLLQAMPEGDRPAAPSALVLAPTRELAQQVSEAVHRYGRGLGVRVLPIYGGAPFGRQLKALDRGVDVVVATPGRALDHLGRGSLDLSGVRTVVLDEADEMLDMGFAEDLEALLDAVPEERQAVLFSATMPKRIEGLARRHLRDPVEIRIRAEEAAEGELPRIRQTAYVVRRADKPAALGRIIDVEAPDAALVFCRTRDQVDQLTSTLNGRGVRAEALHGGMSQEQRERVLGRLRSGSAELLVATDVAARGLDVDRLTHVVNYDVPSSPATYVHRIGRVGRAGREGVAITLAEPREHRMLGVIERVARASIAIERVPTVADLRARRLEAVRAALEESLTRDDDSLDRFRVVVEALAAEHDTFEIALAAVQVAHEATTSGEDDETEIADVRPKQRPPKRERGDARGPREDRGPRPDRAAARGPRLEGPTTRVFIGVGREAGVRPQDLVGAICGETSLTGRDIGAIQVTDRFSLVELPEGDVDGVVDALRQTTIKGRRATVRRDKREDGTWEDRPPRGDKPPWKGREGGGDRPPREDRPPWKGREGGGDRPPRGDKPPWKKRDGGDRPPWKDRGGDSSGRGPRKGPRKPPR